MCTQCVAQSVPYAVVAVGGLRALRWRARRRRLRAPENPPAIARPTP